MNELISIIVPVYNAEKYIEKCIDSIIGQTYKNIEIILIDDGSTDSSGIICDKYLKKDARIKVLHINNSGVSNARNIGLDKATGEWIVFVDSDDWIESNFCEKLYAGLISNPKVDIVCSGYKRIYSYTEEFINCNNKNILYNANQYLLKLLNVQNGYGFCHMKMIRRDCIKDIRFNNKLVVAEDALFNMQILKNVNEVLQIGEGLYNYRFNENSLVRKYDKNYVTKYLNAMKETYKYLKNEYPNNEYVMNNFYNYVSYHVLLIAVNYCFNPKNGKNFIDQKKLLKKIYNIELFKKSIKKCNYNDLSWTRAITIFTLKHKFFILTAMICRFRQIQFRKNRRIKCKQKR